MYQLTLEDGRSLRVSEEAKQAERRAIAKGRAKILQSLVKNPEDPEDSEDTDNRRIEVINP